MLLAKERDELLSLGLVGLTGGLQFGVQALGHIAPIREGLVRAYDEKIHRDYGRFLTKSGGPKAMIEHRRDMALSILYTMNRALDRRLLGPGTLRGTMNIISREILLPKNASAAKEDFQNRYGAMPPSALVVSPTKACNLACPGCYADSGADREKLDFATFRRIIKEAQTLWGMHFFGISGGEPFVYRDGGQGLLDLAAENREAFFLVYTNGTLIDEKTSLKLAQLGNVTPAISVEGLRETTDRRRGEGVFDQIVEAMKFLAKAQVPFGISMTASRDNVEELLAEETLDFYFEKMGALYGWVFQYMPIGRSPSLAEMPTAEQRLKLMSRMWEVVRKKRYFLVDFWNSGILADGCIAAAGRGGYLYIDWNGAVSPCVFMPYSPVNIKDLYQEGKTLNDAWAEPFFAEIRRWQKDYNPGLGAKKPHPEGNLLRPCLIRDHHKEFVEMLKRYEPKPTDKSAEQALKDKKYHRGLEKFDEELAELADPIWEKDYLDQSGKGESYPGKEEEA